VVALGTPLYLKNNNIAESKKTLAKALRAPDLWRGDILLTSMRLRTGAGGVLDNSTINAATGSFYSHAMLYVGSGRIVEYRASMGTKSLRDGVTDSGKDTPAVAHVFRHKAQSHRLRERVIEEARSLANAALHPSAAYAAQVWSGLRVLHPTLTQDGAKRMPMCSTFIAHVYCSAGAPLHPLDPDTTTPARIALCADFASLNALGGSTRDLLAAWRTVERKLNPIGMVGGFDLHVVAGALAPTLTCLGPLDPDEYA
jgi:hypothetical protein